MLDVIRLTVPSEFKGTPLEQDYLRAAEEVLKEQTILRLYREGKISTGAGARLLGMNLRDFIQLLSERKISIFNLSEDELKQEMMAASDAAAPSR